MDDGAWYWDMGEMKLWEYYDAEMGSIK